MSAETVDYREELAELRERVATLESILAADDAPGARDRYDRQVIAKLAETDGSVPVGRLQRWYRHAGIRDKRKTRARIKALAQDGLIENVGVADWRYVGPPQSDSSERS